MQTYLTAAAKLPVVSFHWLDLYTVLIRTQNILAIYAVCVLFVVCNISGCEITLHVMLYSTVQCTCKLIVVYVWNNISCTQCNAACTWLF